MRTRVPAPSTPCPPAFAAGVPAPRTRPRPRPLPCRRLRPTGDRGAAVLEHAGVVLLACTLGVALFGATDNGQRLLAEVRRAVCTALDIGACPDGTDRADDLLPERCATDEHRLSASVGVSVAAGSSGSVRIGERVSSDGSAEVSLTRGLHATADAPNPLHWGAELGPLAEARAGVGAGAHGGAAATHVWTFATKRAADRFRERVARSEHLESLSSDSGAFDALGARIVGAVGDLFGSPTAGTLPPPDRRQVSLNAGLHLAGEAGANLGVGGRGRSSGSQAGRRSGGANGRPAAPGDATADTPRSGRAAPALGTGDDRVSSDLGLLYLVSAGAEGEASLTEAVDERRGTVSRTVGFQFAESGRVGPLMPASSLGRPREARDRLTRASVTTTRDRRTGELAEVAVETVNADDGGVRVVGTARLQVTDANRATVRSWLAGREALTALTFLATTGRPKDAASPKAARSQEISEFDRLLHREATYSTVAYARRSAGREFGADATLNGLSFGGATGWESVTHTATGARYLAAPGPDGRRELVPYEECAW
ncbi:hypothetical protein [Streptomonospora wellingtoniae]|uniref:Flp pilus-assembly TadG-like N-terminal domain-containing protein n=1 Tax=Streptomonospora wellingtoniae TaxID=3075544 RepID=A0ABU2KXT5_9ACTN|nr:hypothetical protein [Streptomonospora sp. DSM 45055]MDT0304111.1 hypothetical protein [Streptomonospora sp. DSM 45055]